MDKQKEHSEAINQKINMLRDLLKSGDFIIPDEYSPNDTLVDFEIVHYSNDFYALTPVFEKSGACKSGPNHYDYFDANKIINLALNNIEAKNLTIDFLGEHPVKSIEVKVLADGQNTETSKVTDVIIKPLMSSNDYSIKLNGSTISDGYFDFGNGRKDKITYMIGHDLHQELGKELTNKILNMKESGVIPYPKISQDSTLLNEFHAEQAFHIIDDMKLVILDRVTSSYARQFDEKQVERILRPDSRLSKEERTALYEDVWKDINNKGLAEARIPEAWKTSAHEELMQLAENGKPQQINSGIHR